MKLTANLSAQLSAKLIGENSTLVDSLNLLLIDTLARVYRRGGRPRRRAGRCDRRRCHIILTVGTRLSLFRVIGRHNEKRIRMSFDDL